MVADLIHRDSGDDAAWNLVAYALAQTDHARESDGSATAPLFQPDSFSGYDLGPLIHRGGQGIVFRATQRSTGRTVAVKVLRDGLLASDADRERLSREARILVDLDHPNIIGISDSGIAAGHNYFVMDFVDGLALDEFVRASNLPLRTTLDLFAKVCEAVQAAHLKGVIHRDLKPSNIRVTSDGTPRVLDFGLAKNIEHNSNGEPRFAASITETGKFVGSLPWASPEQACGDWDRVDTRTDVYSLGVILFQLLTERFPYEVVGPIAVVLSSIANSDPLRPRLLNAKIDDDVETIIFRCLDKEPNRRYQTAGELAKDVRRYLAGEPIEAKSDSAWYILTKKIRRYRVAVAVSLAVGMLGVAAAATMAVLYRDKVRAEGAAEARNREIGAMDAFLNATLGSVNSRSDAEELKFVDLLAKGEDYIKASLQGQPLVEANLRVKLGDAYGRLRLHDEAERHLAAAYEIRKRELGPDHHDTLVAMGRLAQRYSASEKLDKAEGLFRESLRILLTLLHPDHPDVVWKKMHLADVLERELKLDEADTLYREAVDSFTRDPGENYKNYFDATNNYLVFLVDKNRIAQAEPLARTAVESLERHVGPDAPKTKHMLSNQARVLARLGRLEEAAAIYRRLIDDHLRQYGDKKAAEGIVMYLNNLGEILLDQNQLLEAESLLRKALALQERETGEEDRTALLVKGNIACACSQKGADDEAEQLAREVLTTVTRFLGGDSVEAAEAEARLGGVLFDAGKAEEAATLLIASLPRLEAQFGLSDRATLQALRHLGQTQQALGEPSQAEPVLRRAVAAGDEFLAETHWLRATLHGDFGCVLLDLNRETEAEVELLSSVTVLANMLGMDHPRSQHFLRRLVAVYEKLERFEDAGRFRAMLRQ